MSRALALSLVLVVACGGDDVVTVIGGDGGPCPQVSQCDPLAAAGQQGCTTSDKCTALVLTTSPQLCPEAIAMGCAPAGVQRLGETCVWTAATPREPGHDDCLPGLLCASDRVCRDICGFGGSPAEACAQGLSCVAIPGRFEPLGGGEARYGVCAPPL